MRAKELMTTPPYTCGVHDMASVAAQIMWDHDCGVVPVVDDDGRVAGVVTDRDLCMAAHLRGLPLFSIPIKTVMSGDVCSCRPDDDVDAVERRMSERQVRRVPVTDAGGRPLGMLSLSDLALGLQRLGDIQKRPGQELAVTVAAICRPRDERPAIGRAS